MVSPPLSSGLCTELADQHLKQYEDDSYNQLSQTFQHLGTQVVCRGLFVTPRLVLAVFHRFHLRSSHRVWWFDMVLF